MRLPPAVLIFAALFAACDPATDGSTDKDTGDTGSVDTGDSAVDTETGETGLSGDCPDGSDFITYYRDADNDGFGAAATSKQGCSETPGYVADNTDCDDLHASAFPGGSEVCDLLDNDCNGTADDNASNAGTSYADADGDRYGDPDAATVACQTPEGNVSNSRDCDDANSDIHPNAPELCNEADDDCDGDIDENAVATTTYTDSDGDGFGDDSTAIASCDAPSTNVAEGGDCDDGNAAINPDAVEVCDGADNDCEGTIDEGAVDGQTYYADADFDGYGDATLSAVACAAAVGWVSDWTDCDDADGTVNPGATEVCNGVDDDCEGTADSGAADMLTFYSDSDHDGFGDSANFAEACSGSVDWVSDWTDCDDLNAAVNPAEIEVCNGVDDDCEGTVDEGASDANAYYADSDGDGYGNAGEMVEACSASSGWVSDWTDCDDTDGSVNPAASEFCNGVDDNCEGTADEGALDVAVFYADSDGDGYGNPGEMVAACSASSGLVSDWTDCDDTDGGVNPAATEVCNGVDDNCDGTVDTDATDLLTGYSDADSDGFGDPTTATIGCSIAADQIADGTDCDDADSSVYPGAPEVCDDLVVNDCDSTPEAALAACTLPG